MQEIDTNGKVIIIDDKKEEVDPLIVFFKSLNRQCIFIEGLEKIPSDTAVLNDVDMIFLDLNLGTGVNEGTIRSIIKAIKHQNIEPYLLFIWSKNTHEFQSIKEAIENDNDMKEKKCQPFDIIALDKNNYFDFNSGQVTTKSSFNILINREVINKVNKMKGFVFIKKWNQAVKDISEKLIYEIIDTISDQQSDEEDVIRFLNSCSRSYWGKMFDSVSKIQRKDGIYPFLNKFLYEVLNREIPELLNETKFKVGQNKFLNDNQITKLNSMLEFVTSYITVQQGTMFIDNNDFYIKDIFQAKYKAYFEDGNGLSDEQKSQIKQLLDNKISCKLVISPQCQIAQQKNNGKVMVLPCIIIEKNDFINCNKLFEKYLPKEIYYENSFKYFLIQLDLATYIDINYINKNNFLFNISESEMHVISDEYASFISKKGLLKLNK